MLITLFPQCFWEAFLHGLLNAKIMCLRVNTFLIKFADNNFEFGEIDGNFSKRIENTVGYEQFLLFSRCFLKTCTADT